LKVNRAQKRHNRNLARKGLKKAKQVGMGSGAFKQNSLTIDRQIPSVDQAINFAVQHLASGRFPQAKNGLQQILKTDPNQPVAMHLLGVVNLKMEKYEVGIDLIRRSLEIKPDYAEAHTDLGVVFHKLGRLNEAVDSYQKVLLLKPDFAEVHNNLGLVLSKLGNRDDAAASYCKALAIKPHFAEAHHNFGLVVSEQGKLDDAAASYRKALAIKPDLAETHRSLALIKKFSEYDNDIKMMEDAYTSPSLSDEQKMRLSFGLGKALEDLQQHEKAFNYFFTGNALKRRTYNFSVKREEDKFSKIKNNFTKNLFVKYRDAGSSNETPIFILGMPRSGTTLVEQVLASHPNVYGAGELSDFRRITKSNFGKIEDIQFPDRANYSNSRDLLSAGDEYVSVIRGDSETKKFITNKTPHNFLFIGMIKLVLPNAKIIHCCRDSHDTCLSIFKNYFPAENFKYANNLNELGQYYNLYHDLMDHWHEVLPDFIYDIQYEDLVADQEKQSRALLEYCGLEWDDACLEFYKTDRPVKTISSAQVRRPIYKDSVQSWRKYEKWLSPMLEELRQ